MKINARSFIIAVLNVLFDCVNISSLCVWCRPSFPGLFRSGLFGCTVCLCMCVGTALIVWLTADIGGLKPEQMSEVQKSRKRARLFARTTEEVEMEMECLSEEKRYCIRATKDVHMHLHRLSLV